MKETILKKRKVGEGFWKFWLIKKTKLLTNLRLLNGLLFKIVIYEHKGPSTTCMMQFTENSYYNPLPQTNILFFQGRCIKRVPFWVNFDEYTFMIHGVTRLWLRFCRPLVWKIFNHIPVWYTSSFVQIWFSMF